MGLIDTLRLLANTIRNEKKQEANTAQRIGNMFLSVIDYIKSSVQDYTVGLIYQGTVENISDLNSIVDPQIGWAYVVTNSKDPDNGLSYIYQYDGARWNNTYLHAFTSDVATQTDLSDKIANILNDKIIQVDPTVEDNYDTGSILCMYIPEGETTLNLKEKVNSVYPSLATNMTIYSEKKRFILLKKIDTESWIQVGDLLSVEADNRINKVVSDIGATVGVRMKRGSYRLKSNPLESSTRMTIALRLKIIKATDSQYVLSYGTLSENGISILLLGDNTRFFIGQGTVATNGFYINVEDNKEYSFIYTLDENYVRLYSEGILISEKASVSYTLAANQEFNIGGYYNYGEPLNRGDHILKNLIIYNRALIAQEIEFFDFSKFIDDGNLLLNLNKDYAGERLWIDISGRSNSAYIAMENKRAELINVDDLQSSIPEYIEVKSSNLFDYKNNTYTDKILDGSSGYMADWDPALREDRAAVGEFDCEPDKYYLIKNAYIGGYVQAGGVASNGVDLGGILKLNHTGTVVKAERETTNKVDVYKIRFMLYRIPSPSRIPDLSTVEVYEISDPEDFVEKNYSFGQTKEVNDNLAIQNAVNNNPFISTFSSILSEKRFLILGDSITAGGQWVRYMVEKLRLSHVYNMAVGGANIGGLENADGSAGGTDPYDRRHLHPQIKYTPSSLYKEILDNLSANEKGEYILSIDVVMISMGFNDANNARVIGNWNTVKETAWKDLLPSPAVGNFQDVYSALKYCLTWLQQEIIKETVRVDNQTFTVGIDCRQAKIIWQLPIQTSVTTGTETRLDSYRDAIEAVCNYYSIPVIAAHLKSGISREIELLNPQGKYLLDGIHPNADGYIKLGECNTSGLISLFL